MFECLRITAGLKDCFQQLPYAKNDRSDDCDGNKNYDCQQTLAGTLMLSLVVMFSQQPDIAFVGAVENIKYSPHQRNGADHSIEAGV